LPKAWIRERKRDYYYRLAKEEQYRSRAAYKLLEVARKYDLIKHSDVVVDLGAAPGGWMQAARKAVGKNGFVLGVDLKAIEPMKDDNVRSIEGDIAQPETTAIVNELLPHAADVVLSDVAPNVSGVWELDHARQIELAHKSLQLALQVLRPGGNFFVKVFQGNMLDDFVSEVRRYFSVVRLVKPRASRRKSAELFVLGLRKR
jgi:23S rRNA (uridine2552-2'-O)-methyltransferase